MDTDATVRKELREDINGLRERLFGGLKSSLEKLDDFFDKHVKSGRIDPGYESQYKSLLDDFKEQFDDFCQKSKNINFHDMA